VITDEVDDHYPFPIPATAPIRLQELADVDGPGAAMAFGPGLAL
jgi:hypothetical protein